MISCDASTAQHRGVPFSPACREGDLLAPARDWGIRQCCGASNVLAFMMVPGWVLVADAIVRAQHGMCEPFDRLASGRSTSSGGKAKLTAHLVVEVDQEHGGSGVLAT